MAGTGQKVAAPNQATTKKTAPKAPETMALWNRHEKTNPAVTREVKRAGGFKITTIDAYHQIKEATEEWGPMGDKWGVTDAKWSTDSFIDPLGVTRTMGTFTGRFYYPGADSEDRASFPMSSVEEILQLRGGKSGAPYYVYVDDEWTKKTFTNALTKALSYVGFNADVFMGKFDDNRYVAERRIEENEKALAERDNPVTDAIQVVTQPPTNMPPKMAPEQSRPAQVHAIMGDDVNVLVAKIQDYAMNNADFIASEALAALPGFADIARRQPDPVGWLEGRYEALLAAVSARKAEKPPAPKFEDDIPF
jgi:hypothetical protein